MKSHTYFGAAQDIGRFWLSRRHTGRQIWPAGGRKRLLEEATNGLLHKSKEYTEHTSILYAAYVLGEAWG